MMRLSLITLFPEMFSALDHSITGRAKTKGLINVETINPRDHADNKHRRIDDEPYGGGPGMVMQAPPLVAAIAQAKKTNTGNVVYLSPQGRRLTQTDIQQFAQRDDLILLCGRYEGIDERVLTHHVDDEVSIGDYVLSGGELAAMVLIDAITRLLPGALGDPESAQQDSFCNGLLDHPHYTRPEEFEGNAVPEVLRSGDHQRIARWRLQQALGNTAVKRPDLLATRTLTQAQQTLLEDFKRKENL